MRNNGKKVTVGTLATSGFAFATAVWFGSMSLDTVYTSGITGQNFLLVLLPLIPMSIGFMVAHGVIKLALSGYTPSVARYTTGSNGVVRTNTITSGEWANDTGYGEAYSSFTDSLQYQRCQPSSPGMLTDYEVSSEGYVDFGINPSNID